MKTENIWVQDASGLWHWRGAVAPTPGKGRPLLHVAAKVALEGRPDSVPGIAACVCWFWWKGAPCPMVRGDTVTTLVERWREWHDECFETYGLVELLTRWSTIMKGTTDPG